MTNQSMYMLICMCMLTKRANILFDEELWQKLIYLSRVQKTSIGKLVREAVEQNYGEEAIINKRRQAFKNILKYRPKPYRGRIDYKELINAGRKIY